MFEFQYLMPDSYPEANGSFDRQVMEMCAKLRGVDTNGARIPNSALSVRLNVMENCSMSLRYCFDRLPLIVTSLKCVIEWSGAANVEVSCCAVLLEFEMRRLVLQNKFLIRIS